jgi:hypothetical protein
MKSDVKKLRQKLRAGVNKSVCHVAIIGNQDLLRNPQPAVCARSRHTLGMQCSGRRQRSTATRMRTQPAQHCSTSHQIRCVCASSAWLEAQQDPFLDRSSGCRGVASVARLMPGHPIARDLESLVEEWHYSVGNRRTA